MKKYDVIALDPPPYYYSPIVRDLNSVGTAVGYAGVPMVGHAKAMEWHDGSPDTLPLGKDGTKYWSFSKAFGLNDARDVVGVWGQSDPAMGEMVKHGFLAVQGGPPQSLGPRMGTSFSSALDINNRGRIVGSAGTFAGFDARAYLLDPDADHPLDLGTHPNFKNAVALKINDGPDPSGAADQVVGRCSDPGEDPQLFVYDPARRGTTDLILLGACTSIGDLSDKGLVVGSRVVEGAGERAFVYNLNDPDAEFIEIPPLVEHGHTASRATGVNGAGDVVGVSFDPSVPGARCAFIAPGGGAPRDLNPDIHGKNPNVPPWVLQEAVAINDAGAIAGVGLCEGRRRLYLLVPLLMPEVDFSGLPLLTFLGFLGAVESDGGGLGFPAGGGPPVPIGPYDPLSPATRDGLVGFALREFGGRFGDAETRRVVERAGIDVVLRALQRIEAGRPG